MKIEQHTGPNGISFVTFTEKADRRRVLLKLAAGNVLVYDTETTGLRVASGEHECVMIGMMFIDPNSSDSTQCFCMPWDNDMKHLFEELVEVSSLVVAHGLRFDSNATGHRLPIVPTKKYFDTQMHVYFRDTAARKSLDDLAPAYGYNGGKKIKTPALVRQGRIREMDQLEAFEYLADDVLCSGHVFNKVRGDSPSWVENVDVPLEGVVQRMEQRGAMIIRDRMEEAFQQALRITAEALDRLQQVGGDINFNSPKQLPELFKARGWPMGLTKTGNPSITKDILESMGEGHPNPIARDFANDLLSWRKHSKLQGSFFGPMLDRLGTSPTGLVHGRFNTMSTKTGRFSCEDPNWQQASNARGDTESLSYWVRGSITHEGGCTAGDFSQVELRVVAAIAQEPALIEAFRKGLDVHAATAAKMFGCAVEDVTPVQRNAAKAVNFGLLYGMTEFGLAHQLKCSKDEALSFMVKHERGLPVLARWKQERLAVYEDQGLARTLSGRTRRYNYYEATKSGLSVEVQGTAAEMMRAALVALEQENMEPFIQIHDEAVCKGRGDKKKQAVASIMQKAAEKAFPKLAELVSFPCDAGDGDNWAEAH